LPNTQTLFFLFFLGAGITLAIRRSGSTRADEKQKEKQTVARGL